MSRNDRRKDSIVTCETTYFKMTCHAPKSVAHEFDSAKLPGEGFYFFLIHLEVKR